LLLLFHKEKRLKQQDRNFLTEKEKEALGKVATKEFFEKEFLKQKEDNLGYYYVKDLYFDGISQLT
jgi:hypothetical protein